MIQFWKDNSTLRVALIALSFIAGMALIIFGWRQTGKLWGLGVMLVGLVLLLVALWLYNIVFTDAKEKKVSKK